MKSRRWSAGWRPRTAGSPRARYSIFPEEGLLTEEEGMRKALMLAVLAVFSTAGFAQQKLKFAHVYETTEPYHTEAVWAAGEIAKRTANRYTMDVFPASQLGNETQINQSLSLGTVDMIYT